MKIAKLTSIALFVGSIITIGLRMHPAGYEKDDVVVTDQSGGFQYFWNTTNFHDPVLHYCTALFNEMLKGGEFLQSARFLDNVITCPDYYLPPNLYTMVHCRDRGECNQCLENAASLMDQCCVDCYGFRALSDDCWVRYETYSFSSYN